MANATGAGDLVDLASSGVENLAGAATSALDQAGPIGELAQPVVGLLRNVWEGYFGVPIPPGTTNWNAYSHQQLYDMLWNGHADVGDVSSVADEWGRHSSGLADNANALHSQQSTLQENWSGAAAQPAAARIGQLSTQSSDIGARAATVQQSTQNAGDSLAVARNTMPPPPGDPTGLAIAGAAAGAGVGALIGGALGAAAGGIGAGPGALMGAAIGAVAGGGASLFLASVAAAEQKAQAVHVMQTYETGLTHSSTAVAAATGSAAAGSGSTSVSGYVGPSTGGVGGGVPWNRLVGASPLSTAVNAGRDVSGIGMLGSGLTGQYAASAEELAGESALGQEGMAPGMGRTGRREEDREHDSALPTVDQKLFDVGGRATPSVIEDGVFR
ncbi:MAG TPA: hypothetical protein VGM75_11195 [Pseudonocardiaceae bacterium]